MTSNLEQQIEEQESLAAIYGEDVEFDPDLKTCLVHLPSRGSSPPTVLRALLPPGYPSTAGPVIEVDAPHLPAGAADNAVRVMEGMFNQGDVCLFACIEWMREQLQRWQEEAEGEAAALAAAVDALDASSSSSGADEGDELDPSLGDLTESSGRDGRDVLLGACSHAEVEVVERMRPLIVSGEPFTERKSTFQAHVAPVTELSQVKAVVAVLLENNKVRHATHNIMAYRIAAPGRPGAFYQDFDDDGEAAAGGRLLHLLQVADVQNAVVVVSRWFGGVLLGPARFSLINNTARQLLDQLGYVKPHGGGGAGKGGAKKQQQGKRRQ